MRYVAGKGIAAYPGFSQDPLDGFRHLSEDLKKYGADFLSGTGFKLKKAIIEMKKRENLSGLFRLQDQADA